MTFYKVSFKFIFFILFILLHSFCTDEEDQLSEGSKTIVLSTASRHGSGGRKIPLRLLKVNKQSPQQVTKEAYNDVYVTTFSNPAVLEIPEPFSLQLFI